MKPSHLLSAFAALATAVTAQEYDDDVTYTSPPTGRIAPVYIQPISSSSPPVLLAELNYHPSSSTNPSSEEDAPAPSVLSYEPPEFDPETKLVRVGVYDEKTGRWASSAAVVSVENFGQGYQPNFVLNVDEKGEEVVGVVVRGVRVDAGQTRNFGPRVVVRGMERGRQPGLGKPVVLSAEGRKVEVEERSFLQKWVAMMDDIMGVCANVRIGTGGRFFWVLFCCWEVVEMGNERFWAYHHEFLAFIMAFSAVFFLGACVMACGGLFVYSTRGRRWCCSFPWTRTGFSDQAVATLSLQSPVPIHRSAASCRSRLVDHSMAFARRSAARALTQWASWWLLPSALGPLSAGCQW